MSTKSMLHRMAYSSRLQAAARAHAERIAARIRTMNPDADLKIEDTDFAINGFGRRGVIIRDVSTTATKHEYGGPGQPAWRAMARAADFFRE